MEFKKIMETLKKIKDLKDIKLVNRNILEKYPKNNFIKENSKNYFRPFVMWLLTKVPKDKFEEPLKLINTIYANLYTNTSTLDSMLSKDVRTIISEKYGEKSQQHTLSKELVKIPYEEKGNLIKEQEDKVRAKNKNRLEFQTDEVMKIIKNNINSDDPLRNAISLLIASGCRPIELFEKAKFKANPEVGPNWIIQDYVAKRKDKDAKALTKPIIYFKADEFIDHLKTMRAVLHEKYPDFVNSKGELISSISSKTNLLANEIFEYREGFTLYTSRKIYGITSYNIYHKTTDIFGKNPSHNEWLNDVLGHSRKSIMSSFNYSHIELITPEDLAIKQTILETKIEEVEEKLEECCKNEPEVHVEKPIKQTTPEALHNKKILDTFKLIKPIYDEYVKNKGKNPTQTELEKLAKDVSTRVIIRRFWNEEKGKN